MNDLMSGDRSSSNLVAAGQLYGWRHRVREIDEEIRTLGAEKSKLERLIEMAEMLEQEARLLEAASDSHPSHPKFITKALEGLDSSDNFPKAVMVIAERAEDGVTYDGIREAILLSPLASRFRKSDKGFYHALRRAKVSGALVEHRGYVFTPANLDAFRRKVAAGLKQDKKAEIARGSPMHDLILETVAKTPGLIAKEIIEAVRDQVSNKGLPPIKNENSVYNAIARLKQRQELEGFGHQDRQLRIGVAAPEDIKRLVKAGVVVPLTKRTEAPHGKAAGASEAGPLFGSSPRS